MSSEGRQQLPSTNKGPGAGPNTQSESVQGNTYEQSSTFGKGNKENTVEVSHGINAHPQGRRAEDINGDKVVASAETNPEFSARCEEEFCHFWGRTGGCRAENNKTNEVVASPEANAEFSAGCEEDFWYFWGKTGGCGAEDKKSDKVVASAKANPEFSTGCEEEFWYFWGRIGGQ
ncbi:hypothetical protein MMC28_005073 [Mycoblastus sanguinarius]|nr:hypothetical protein [Mycoblastus sanguinarius]